MTKKLLILTALVASLGLVTACDKVDENAMPDGATTAPAPTPSPAPAPHLAALIDVVGDL